MKFIICLFIYLSSYADYPYFNFTKKMIKISSDSHNRYIRPQLKNIKTEFYHIAKKVSPIQGQIIKLRESGLVLITNYLTKYEECLIQQKEQVYCDVSVVDLINQSYDLDRNILQLRRESLSKDFLNEQHINSYVAFSKHLDEIEVLNSTLQRYFELKNIVRSTVYTTYTTHFTDLSNTVIKLNNTLNFLFIDPLPLNLQGYFESLLVHYIAPLESRMINDYSPDWFILELGALNITWNTFHMNIEKGEEEIPDGVISTVKMMHNRWNSILKLIF